MVDFRKMSTPRTQVQMRRVRQMLEEFSDMQKSDQARTLLSITRKAFDAGGYQEDMTRSYDEWALLRVLPEIARRIDPSIGRLPREIPSADEAIKDPVTDILGADLPTLNRYAENIISHASFRQIPKDDPENRDVYDLLATWREDGIIARAMHILSPENWPLPKREPREELMGLWVVLESPAGAQKVLGYTEGPNIEAKIDACIARVMAWAKDPTSEGGHVIQERLKHHPRPEIYDRLLVQDANAVTHFEVVIRPAPEKAVSPTTCPTL